MKKEKAYERLHFLQRTWGELKRLKEVYGNDYSKACIKYMKQIAKWLDREIKLHEKAKRRAKKMTPKKEKQQPVSKQVKAPK